MRQCAANAVRLFVSAVRLADYDFNNVVLHRTAQTAGCVGFLLSIAHALHTVFQNITEQHCNLV